MKPLAKGGLFATDRPRLHQMTENGQRFRELADKVVRL
jgi:hypothetical protein